MKVRATVFIALSLFLFAVVPGGSSGAVLGGSIEYTKSGGIAGIDESMKIDRNGRGKIARKSFRLTSRQGRSLAAAIRRADLAHVKSPKGGSCCDFFEYSVRYRGHRVTWDENNSEQIPERVLDLQSMLAELYERYASR